ncbi:unnamed protein product [Paramecium octaurelia]|uniref:WD domain, G-beta repeat protein n=1 Tax=Paramecium octaurelia TaxID=43137 RepID=A0A8S1WJH5_PAROT|nr:unnamed protein product [Paramecium octaurelia]
MSKEMFSRQLEYDFKVIEKQLDLSKQELYLLKVPQFNLIDQTNFKSNIVQEVKPLIISKIKQQFNLKQQSDQQLQQSSFPQSQSIQCPSQFKPFNYQIIKDNSIYQNEWCCAIAYNKDCSCVALSCDKQIKIYEFKQAILKQIHVLYQHQKDVLTLSFMKKSNQFISGDSGGSILIWSINKKWYCSQTIQAHIGSIRCLIMNNNEDLFITSSYDNTIKFWVKQNDWIWQQTITDHKLQVNQLSLNDKENKVISCGEDKLILVIEYFESDKKWILIQNIIVEDLGCRICFINNNQFTFQPIIGNLMHVYQLNNISKQFVKSKDINVNESDSDFGELFPQQFLKQKQLLVSKHGNSINLIRKTEVDQFIVEQSIQFDSYYIFGQMSDDGEYLITWDSQSNQIQIRKYAEQ